MEIFHETFLELGGPARGDNGRLGLSRFAVLAEGEGWPPVDPVEVLDGSARVLPQSAFRQAFGSLPPLGDA